MTKNVVVTLILCVLMVSGCQIERNNKDRSTRINKAQKTKSTDDKWYLGGTLHKSTIGVWKKSSEKNKLATCADFVASVKKDITLDELKVHANALKRCIDKSTEGLESTDSEKVSDIAATCSVLMER